MSSNYNYFIYLISYSDINYESYVNSDVVEFSIEDITTKLDPPLIVEFKHLLVSNFVINVYCCFQTFRIQNLIYRICSRHVMLYQPISHSNSNITTWTITNKKEMNSFERNKGDIVKYHGINLKQSTYIFLYSWIIYFNAWDKCNITIRRTKPNLIIFSWITIYLVKYNRK